MFPLPRAYPEKAHLFVMGGGSIKNKLKSGTKYYIAVFPIRLEPGGGNLHPPFPRDTLFVTVFSAFGTFVQCCQI